MLADREVQENLSTASSGRLFPRELIETVKSEAKSLEREQRTRTFYVEYRVTDGVPLEARVRSRESLIVVPLTS